jgi:mannose/fructose/N-acetylgalactosamine-specific phosphotransferase system component IIC
MAQTRFNLEYVISLAAALGSAYMIQQAAPSASPTIKFFIVPLLVAYLVLTIANVLFPHINATGNRVKAYVENKTLGEINNMGYLQIFPPLFAILIVFIVLLYSRSLG